MDEIEQNIRNLSNDELLQMIKTDYDQYTDEALKIASDELTKRRFSEREMETLHDDFSDDEDSSEQPENASTDEFLVGELEYQESFSAILDFVMSVSIRNGEYEGNRTIFKKMDRENFILYTENMRKDNSRSIRGCIAITKDNLIDKINEIARANGFELGE